MKAPARHQPGFRGIVVAAVTVILAVVLPASALAQGGAPGIPVGGGYAASPLGPDGTRPMPDADSISQDDGSSFSVPLPGGGQIQVNGPASEPLNVPPPTENWSTLRNIPFSPGGTPLGPVPAE